MTQTQMTRQQILDMQDDRHRLLTTRVRELEEENARLVSAIDEHMVVSHIGVFNRGDDPKIALNKIACYEQSLGEYFGKELKDQLAASQVYAEQLREALVEARGYLDRMTQDGVRERCDKALALPRDTSALDAYVADRTTVQQAMVDAMTIRVNELTRQRDLAVEALERQLADAKHCQQVMCNEVGIGFLDVVTLSNSEAVLSTIKGSDAGT